MRHPVCLGYQIATPEVAYSDELTCLYGDIEENIRFLRDVGYDAVEFMSVDPKQLDAGAVRGLLDKYHMRGVLVCTGEVYGTLGLSFLDPDEDVRRQAVVRICEIIDFAETLGANINIGRARGKLRKADGMNDAPALAAFREVCRYAAPKNVDVLIEPIEKPYANYINTIADGAALCQALDEGNFHVMMDYSAMCFEEESMADAARRFGGRCVTHVHLSEADRHYPGHGSPAPFKAFIGQLAQAGYAGPFVMEIYPLPEQKTAATEAFNAIAPILSQAYGWRAHRH